MRSTWYDCDYKYTYVAREFVWNCICHVLYEWGDGVLAKVMQGIRLRWVVDHTMIKRSLGMSTRIPECPPICNFREKRMQDSILNRISTVSKVSWFKSKCFIQDGMPSVCHRPQAHREPYDCSLLIAVFRTGDWQFSLLLYVRISAMSKKSWVGGIKKIQKTTWVFYDLDLKT